MVDSKKIFIVDDDPQLLSLYKEAIYDRFPEHELSTFSAGSDCLAKIEEGQLPDLVVTDLKMPVMNGHVLVKKILSVDARIPVALNTGFGAAALESGGVEIGYRAILEKGISMNEFLNKLIELLNCPAVDDVDHHLRIEYEMLLKLDKAPFGINVKLNDGKFVNLIKQGDPVPKDKIKEYKEKGVMSYYIALEDFQASKDALFLPFRTTVFQVGQTLDFNVYIRGKEEMKRLIGKGTTLIAGHLELLKKHSFSELFYDNSEEKDYFEYLDKVINTIAQDDKGDADANKQVIFQYAQGKMEVALGSKHGANAEEILRIVDVLEVFTAKNKKVNFNQLANSFKDNSIQHHSIRVAFLCMGVIYKILQWRVSGENKKLIGQFDSSIHDGKEMRKMVITAAMTHDLGAAMTDDPMEAVTKSVELLERRKTISPKIAEIVLQHKEMLDGSGGPNKLVKRQLTIYSQLLSLVNYYDELICEGSSAKDAVIDLQMNPEKFNKNLAAILSIIVS